MIIRKPKGLSIINGCISVEITAEVAQLAYEIMKYKISEIKVLKHFAW